MKSCPLCKQSYPGGVQFCPTDGTRLVEGEAPATNDPQLGHDFGGRYKLLQVLGQGGLGVVYEAEHIEIGRRVAIKVLRDEVSRNPTVLQRFRQEAKSASRIGHENIVDILDFGETAYGSPYLVMEMLAGEDLAHLLKRERQLPLERVLPIIIQCCRALSAAHIKGIVHRDMKPENIFLTSRDGKPDFVKIVDFGIAKMNDLEQPGEPGRKLTKTGMIFGTPEYMSPEQAAGKESDHRVDIYAMGIIIFEIVSGRVPFVGDSFMAVLTQHLLEPVPRVQDVNPAVDLPPALDMIIQRALQKHPDHRYQEMDTLADELQALLDGSGELPRAPVDTIPEGGSRLPSRDLMETVVGASAPPARRWGWLWVLLSILGVGTAGWYASEVMTPTENGDVVDAGVSTVLGDGGLGPAEQGADASEPTRDANVDAELPIGTEPDASVVGPERVSIRIVSQPSGARLVSPRLGCSSTPCTVRAPLGRVLSLKLSMRGRIGLRRVRVAEDGQSVRVRMQPCCRLAPPLRCPEGPDWPRCF